MSEFLLIIGAEDAPKIKQWIEAGACYVWSSLDLGNLGRQWITPVNQRPHWAASLMPKVITDLAEVGVQSVELFKRFHIGVQRGPGLSWEVTDGGSRRIRAAEDKAGDGSYHTFDYEAQDVLIWKQTGVTPLSEWQA